MPTDFKTISNYAFGQAIAVLGSGTALFSNYLSQNQVSVPAFQSLFLYILLSLVYLTYFYGCKRPSIAVPMWFYVIMGLIDVVANYFAVLAFRGQINYAILGLILHLSVVFVCFLSMIFLRKRYRVTHYIGCVIALGGSIVVFFSTTDSNSYPDQIRGNLYSVAAAFLYAVSNLLSEYCVKKGGLDANIESLGKMGFFSMLFSALIAVIWEREDIQSIEWTTSIGMYLFGYVVCAFTFYTIVSIFLRITESLMFNVSLLTSDVFNAITSYIFFDALVPNLYWLALALNLVGTAVYSFRPPIESPATTETGNQNGQNHVEFAEVASPAADHNVKVV